MDSYRSYNGKAGASHRRHHTPGGTDSGGASRRRGIRLIICAALFAIAVFMKLVFPSTLQAVGDKLNTVVNYRAALATLGEGISGKKSFTAALGEAFTYAFTGTPTGVTPSVTPAGTPAGVTSTSAAPSASAPAVTNHDTKQPAAASPSAGVPATGAKASDSGKTAGVPTGDTSVQTFSQQAPATTYMDEASSVNASGDKTAVPSADKAFSDAVIAAFLESQEQYSDYAVPAGVSYGMPKLSYSFIAPVKGTVSSSFGYRLHPTDKTVKFHYGTDIAAKTGTPVVAFADGKVIATGESDTLGKYAIISHAGDETEYGHCDKVFVTSGQAVKKGEKIAAVGKTGNATETCLHFELRISSIYVNPEFYVRQWM